MEFAAAEQHNNHVLEWYNAIKNELEEGHQAKPDMRAYCEVKEAFRMGVYGHIRVVAAGRKFEGRAQLAVLGLHNQLMRGVDKPARYDEQEVKYGAVAVVMAGNHNDNADTGETFIHTGEGGQKDGKQVEDQSYTTPGNAALMDNYRTGTPLRVLRMVSRAPPVYVYQGLYQVVNHWLENSSDGPMVLLFKMRGVRGH